jgi:hypothetical protein
MERGQADRWEARIQEGAVLVGAHVDPATSAAARDVFTRNAASSVVDATWEE